MGNAVVFGKSPPPFDDFLRLKGRATGELSRDPEEMKAQGSNFFGVARSHVPVSEPAQHRFLVWYSTPNDCFRFFSASMECPHVWLNPKTFFSPSCCYILLRFSRATSPFECDLFSSSLPFIQTLSNFVVPSSLTLPVTSVTLPPRGNTPRILSLYAVWGNLTGELARSVAVARAWQLACALTPSVLAQLEASTSVSFSSLHTHMKQCATRANDATLMNAVHETQRLWLAGQHNCGPAVQCGVKPRRFTRTANLLLQPTRPRKRKQRTDSAELECTVPALKKLLMSDGRAEPASLAIADMKALETVPRLELEELGQKDARRLERRRAAKLERYLNECTRVTELLFVGGDKVARDLAQLQANKITHIVNCAGDLCGNYFENKFSYYRLYLLDQEREDIQCLLYDVIDFIDEAKAKGGRVLVHCHQGVSRSTVFVIAYLMLKNDWEYRKAFDFVKARRGVAKPNFGFICQLINWYQRTKDVSLPPFLYAVHTRRKKRHDGKLLATQVRPFSRAALVSTHVLILHAVNTCYLWCGSDILAQDEATPENTCENSVLPALQAAWIHVRRIQKYEHASSTVEIEFEGHETTAFWKAFDEGRESSESEDEEEEKEKARKKPPPAPRRHHQQRSNNLSRSGSRRFDVRAPSKPTHSGASSMDVGSTRLEPSFFAYPSWEPLEMFDEEDLDDNSVFILLMRAEDRARVHVWIGEHALKSLHGDGGSEEEEEEGRHGLPKRASAMSLNSDSMSIDEEEAEQFAQRVGKEFLQALFEGNLGVPVEVQAELSREESDLFWAAFL